MAINQVIACIRNTKIKNFGSQEKNHRSLNKSCHQRCSVKNDVLTNFAIFTGKHQCWSLFLIKFLCLSEADQSLLKKEAAGFPQSEEISSELLYNLHYSNKFYLEAHRLLHPQIMSTHISKNALVLFQNVISKSAVLQFTST